MENGNVNNNGTVNTNGQNVGTTENPQVGEQPNQTQQPPQIVYMQQPPQAQQQDGWWKRNWKKVTGITAAVGTAVATAVVAFNKGKRVGTEEGYNYQQQEQRSPLDPNV